VELSPACQLTALSISTLLLSYIGVAGVRRWAERRRILDIPNERSSHTTPIPRGGGLAIVFFCLVGLTAAWLNDPLWPPPALLCYLLAAVLVASISWIDDVRTLPNHWRLAAHSAGAILALFGMGYWTRVNVPLFGALYLGFFGLLVTFMWIVGLTNAYNFMDGIDGIAGGQAIVAGLGWTLFGFLTGDRLLGSFGLLTGMASLGFLFHNWPPARIFMGDVGSAFLGYTFAVLPIVTYQDTRSPLLGVLFVWPFVFDTAFTFLKRFKKRENVFAAHRSHLYQRLVIAGYSHRFVTILYMGLALAGVFLGLFWLVGIKGSDGTLSVALPLLCFGLWLFVTLQERRKPDPPSTTRKLVSH
jgi:UDP-N-acetylmuramyl pentapeptide phosphotransferase/UDP-N-acetylglucosamine-1-phosphate transferase